MHFCLQSKIKKLSALPCPSEKGQPLSYSTQAAGSIALFSKVLAFLWWNTKIQLRHESKDCIETVFLPPKLWAVLGANSTQHASRQPCRLFYLPAALHACPQIVSKIGSHKPCPRAAWPAKRLDFQTIPKCHTGPFIPASTQLSY